MKGIQFHFSCFVCDTTLKLKSYLRTHLKGHIAELLSNQTFSCDVCLKVYASKANVELHKTEVHTHKADQIKCDICSKAYVSIFLHWLETDDRYRKKLI